MNHTDIINAFIEVIGSLFTLMNVVALYRDKMVRGVSLLPVVFFTVWGGWNVFFYHHNGLYWSAIGGLAMFAVNTSWLAMAVYYERHNLLEKIRKLSNDTIRLRKTRV